MSRTVKENPVIENISIEMPIQLALLSLDIG
jgi:hypothetical protein